MPDLTERIRQNVNASTFSRNQYSSRFWDDKPQNTGGFNGLTTPHSFNPDLDTPEGLYKLAQQQGLGDQARRVLDEQGGESQKLFSGGFLMDVMDVLNMGSYGMVGVLKGVGFAEGVKNRETFTDEDSLGKNGIMGKVLGFAMDIAVDPLTYIAPWKIASKIPGVTNAFSSMKTKALGEFRPVEIGGQEVMLRSGGWRPVQLIQDNLAYGVAVDPSYLKNIDQLKTHADVGVANIDRLMSSFAKLDPKAMKETITDDGVSLTRRSITDIETQMRRDLDPKDFNEQFGKVKEIWDLIDNNSRELSRLGVFSKEAVDKHINDFLRQSFRQFEDAKIGKGKQGVGVKAKARKDLDIEQRRELGLIEDPMFAVGNTLLEQNRLIHNAKLQNYLSDKVAVSQDALLKSNADVTAFTRVPDAPQYQTRRDLESNLKVRLGEINTVLKRNLKQFRKTFKENDDIIKELNSLEKRAANLAGKSDDELAKFFSDADDFIVRNSNLTTRNIPKFERLKPLHDDIQKFLKKKGMLSGQKLRPEDAGKSLKELAKQAAKEWEKRPGAKRLREKFFESGAVERAYRKSGMSFEDYVATIISPSRKTFSELRLGDEFTDAADAGQDAALKKAQKAKGDEERTLAKIKELREGPLKDAQRKLLVAEETLNDLRFAKEDVAATLERNDFGNLAGKYVPNEVWNMVKGTFEPRREVGEKAVLFFKNAAVIWNPAAFPRNAMGAMIANWWETGLGPWRLGTYLDARKSLKAGSKDKYVKEMFEMGFHERTGATYELINNMVNSGIYKQAMQESTNVPVQKIIENGKAINKTLVETYGWIDNVAKVAAYKGLRRKGVGKEEALRKAYAATFNYSQVTPFVQSLRRAIWGVPFITFNLKAVPLTARTLAENPQRISVFGKARNSLFEAAGVQGEQEAEAQPEWMRDSTFMLRLPWKDGEGRSMYFDLSYIVPFGAIMDGSAIRDPIANNPFLQTVRELSQNRTFGGQKIFLESGDYEQTIADVFAHVGKLWLPRLAKDQLPQGYTDDGERVPGLLGRINEEDSDLGPGEKSFYQKTFQNIGLNVTPFDLESRQRALRYRQREALQQLLVQNGILNEFTKPYIPTNDDFTPILDTRGTQNQF